MHSAMDQNIESVLDDALECLTIEQNKTSDSNPPKLTEKGSQSELEESEELLLEKLKSIHQHFSNLSQNASETDDTRMLDEMMQTFTNSFHSTQTEGSNDNFDHLMEGIVDEMLSKEVLYEPLKELHTQFPAWLQRNTSLPNIKTYQQQYEILTEIVALFEHSEYSMEKERKRIEDLVNRLQEFGNPPEELLM